MTRFKKIVERINTEIINLNIAFEIEKDAQKQVLKQLKEDLKVNLVDGIKSGKVFAKVKENTKEAFKFSNYVFGYKAQSIPNRINVLLYKDRSRNFVNGRKYGFDLSFRNRWEVKQKNTHICLTQGLIVPKTVDVHCDGVNFPPRFKWDN